jgi:hypothetical protein
MLSTSESADGLEKRMVATYSRIRRRWFSALAAVGAAGFAPQRRADAQQEQDGAMSREVLGANRTYYVRSDAAYTDAPGRLDTQAGACKTWQQAVNLVMALDLNGHVVTIQHGAEGAHTFTEQVQVGTMVGGGQLVVSGLNSSGSTLFNVAGNPWMLTDVQTYVVFQNMKLQGAGGDFALIEPIQRTLVGIGSGMIFGAASNAHIWVHDRQAMLYLLSSTYQITAGAPYHILVNGGMCFHESSVVTLTGTPAFTQFVTAINGGAIQTISSTFTGAATGSRYGASTNGVVNTFGGGASYFPGNAAGSTATGGQYA